MKRLFFLFLFLLTLYNSYSQTNLEGVDTLRADIDKTQSAIAIKIAANFLTALIENKSIDSILDFCLTPFYYGDTVLALNRSQLKNILSQTIESFQRNKKLEPHIDAPYLFGFRQGVVNGIVPLNVYFVMIKVNFKNGSETFFKQIVLAVQIGEYPKIVGFGE